MSEGAMLACGALAGEFQTADEGRNRLPYHDCTKSGWTNLPKATGNRQSSLFFCTANGWWGVKATY